MTNKPVLGVLGLSLATGVVLILLPRDSAPVAVAQTPTATPPPPSVEVVEAVGRTLPETALYTGRLAAVEHVDLRPRVGGYIKRVRFREGSLVKKGDVLFEIDAAPFAAAVARAKAQLAQAQARRTLAERRASRARVLRADDVIAQAELETTVAEDDDSAAAVQAARAVLQAAMLDLSDTRVRSPIDGRVGEALATKGNLVSSGTRLTTIVSVDSLHVAFDMDESTFRRFTIGKRTAPAHVLLADETGEGRRAELDFVANYVDTTTGTARARAVVPNTDGQLTPGLFARVRLETGAPRATVLVREETIGTSAQGRYVLAVKPDGTVELRHVELGESVDGLRVIRSGLTAGEHVILKGMARPGMKVTPKLATGGVP